MWWDTIYKEAYTKCGTWLNNYLSEVNSLESSLASFSGNITSPSEFSGEFIDMFGKVTMPVLKTGGDKEANYKTFGGAIDKEETTKAGDLTGSTNQDKIFNYLKSQGFNNAAICGILSNIQHESNFNPHSLGDGGTSYGICQWHYGRWTNLKNYCKKNNLNSTTLEGQLSYLVHELKTSYPSIYKRIKNVPNTKEGAYQAAYDWTVNFEVPVNRYQNGKKRGNVASSKYWNSYGTRT